MSLGFIICTPHTIIMHIYTRIFLLTKVPGYEARVAEDPILAAGIVCGYLGCIQVRYCRLPEPFISSMSPRHNDVLPQELSYLCISLNSHTSAIYDPYYSAVP